MINIELVREWSFEQGAGVVVNGRPLRIAVAIEGPMVEAMDEYHHVLWMPLIAEGAAPRAGRPEGEPAARIDQAAEAAKEDVTP